SDSERPAIGIETTWSLISRARRDSPLPSAPTTSAAGCVPSTRPRVVKSPSASRPSTNTPLSFREVRVRLRLVTWATRTRPAAPAATFHTLAVIATLRRSGRITPCAPKASAERRIAPRFRGSVMPSSATSSGGSKRSAAMRISSSISAYSYGGIVSATPWWTAWSVIRSRSVREASATGRPRAAARRMISRIRSSVSTRTITVSWVAGTSSRSASSTALRPATWSLPGDFRAPLPPPPRRAPPEGAEAPLYALWFGRSSAFGVGPLPSRARRRTPPEPTLAPFLPLRTAPRRELLPAIARLLSPSVPGAEAPAGAVRPVLDTDPAGAQRIAKRIGPGPVLLRARRLPGGQLRGDQRVERLALAASGAAGACPLRTERVQPQHCEHRPRPSQRVADLRRLRAVPPGQEGVQCGLLAMDHREGLRHGEVVVHRGGEVRGQLDLAQRRVEGRARMLPEPPGGPDGGRAEALPDGLRLGHRGRVVLDGGPVVAADQSEADGRRGVPGQGAGGGDEVVQALAHLHPVHGEHAGVHPPPSEAVSGGAGLRLLVLVVREAQVEAAGVDVEGLAQVLAAHGGALEMPARSPAPEGGVPGGAVRLGRLGRLPQREIATVALAGLHLLPGVLHVLEGLAGQRSVLRVRGDVEVDGAVPVGVGVAPFDEALHQRDHLGDVTGRARLVRGAAVADPVQHVLELALEAQ